MRINGRLLRPSSLAERRVMLSLGLSTTFRCPRSENPYALARRLRRLAEGKNTDAEYIRRIGKQKRPHTSPPQLPDSRSNEGAAA